MARESIHCRFVLYIGNVRYRLSQGTSGRLEVSINGKWGTVCNDNFDTNDAKVICRQLGYSW